MFRISGWVLAFAILAPGWVWGAESSPDELARSIQQLGDADASKRLAAIKTLLAAGDAARPALETAAKSGPRDVRPRAALLLNALAVEPYLAKALKKLDAAESLECDYCVTRTRGSFKGHFHGMTAGERFISTMTVATGSGDVPMRIVANDTVVWSESQPAGAEHKVVQKYTAATMQKMGTTQHLNPLDCVHDLRSRFLFSDMQVDKSSGTELVVFEGSAKDGALDRLVKVVEELGGPSLARATRVQQELMDRARISFTKDGLMLRKIEILGSTGEPLFTMALINVKFDQPFGDLGFGYAPPKDATLVDMDEQLKIARERDGAARP